MALYFRLIWAGIRSRMQYKWDFLLSTLLYGVITAADFMTVAAILYRYKSVAGWNVWEVAVLSGMASSGYGLYRVFCSELDGFERYLVTGEFDNLLIRPWPTLASLLARNFDLGRVGAFCQGLLILTLGLRGAGVQGWLRVYAYLVPVAGACIIAALALISAAAGFWVTRINDLVTFMVNAPYAAANYPMDIFPRWLRRLFTVVLPVAAMGFIPMEYGLGKGGSPVALVVPFVAAGVALAVAYGAWRVGERRYQSSGS
ncbi:MAG TPA: ABC-2 family transporter protein [Symbiobacteriaceae bacterium]|nr:ABC-2 family transporter protein [Symbiobacteriaceae bacterium]